MKRKSIRWKGPRISMPKRMTSEGPFLSRMEVGKPVFTGYWLEDGTGKVIGASGTRNALKVLTRKAEELAKRTPNKEFFVVKPVRKIQYLQEVL